MPRGRKRAEPTRELALAQADAWYVAGELQAGRPVDDKARAECALQLDRASRALKKSIRR